MSRDINLQIEVSYGDVRIERVIASKTTILVGDSKLELDEVQVAELYNALSTYMGAERAGETP